MKQSNTSPNNKVSFDGVLQPFIDILGRNPKNKGRLVGQEIAVPRKDIKAIVALDEYENIHLLISPAVGDDQRFASLNLQGLNIVKREWSVAGHPSQNYLDVASLTGISPSFRRPFLRFAEDVLFEISQVGIIPADAVYRTGVRWRKFWSPDTATGFSTEWLHGIFGELLFLKDLMQRFGANVARYWMGPDGSDHDFQAGSHLAVEVKTSIEMPIRIHCNMRQLDQTIFKKLYLVCYHVSASELGKTITELVSDIEEMIAKDELMLDVFHEQLVKAGYQKQLEPTYKEFRLNSSPASVFLINKSFPKLTEENFNTPLDHRIFNVRYILQVSGIESTTVDAIERELSRFGEI
ncbi:MAG: PD-(D/E)XK motif protein [Patescibacteria group bacterium]|nr:PD-(D/E)XK motif protein [Patescibacteria group bacterium]